MENIDFLRLDSSKLIVKNIYCIYFSYFYFKHSENMSNTSVECDWLPTFFMMAYKRKYFRKYKETYYKIFGSFTNAEH